MVVKKRTAQQPATAAKSKSVKSVKSVKSAKSTKSTKRVGDVIGLSGARPPKPKTPLKAGTRRRPSGIEIESPRTARRHLPPARVKG